MIFHVGADDEEILRQQVLETSKALILATSQVSSQDLARNLNGVNRKHPLSTGDNIESSSGTSNLPHYLPNHFGF